MAYIFLPLLPSGKDDLTPSQRNQLSQLLKKTAFGTLIMDKKLFDKLLESTSQAVDIAAGMRTPSRSIDVTSDFVRAIRESTGLSQEKFASLIRIPVGTLRNWEQGRRKPDGPAAALLTAIRNDPQHVVAALQG